MNSVYAFFSNHSRYLSMSAMAFSPLLAHGQGQDMQEAMEARRLVEETDAFEKSQREKLEKVISEQHTKALEALKRLAQKYKEKGERTKAKETLKVVFELQEKLGEEAPVEIPESDIFEYGKEYLFKSDKIGGNITFISNGNANVIFKMADTPQNVVWKFEEKDDHVLISSGGDLGRIYVSEVPKSDRRSIMIRLGGVLRHHVITATHQ